MTTKAGMCTSMWSTATRCQLLHYQKTWKQKTRINIHLNLSLW